MFIESLSESLAFSLNTKNASLDSHHRFMFANFSLTETAYAHRCCTDKIQKFTEKICLPNFNFWPWLLFGEIVWTTKGDGEMAFFNRFCKSHWIIVKQKRTEAHFWLPEILYSSLMLFAIMYCSVQLPSSCQHIMYSIEQLLFQMY